MDSKVNYALVGLFVLILGAALIAATIWLSTQTSQKAYTTYVAYMYESVSGLNPKAAVKYRGVDVGYVREIALDRENPERVRLLLDIEHDVPVKTDTAAILSTQGITGLAFVDLTGGSREASPLEARPAEPYPQIQTGPSLLVRLDIAVSGLLTELSEVANQLKNVADRVTVLLDEPNQRAIARTLVHLEQLTGSLSTQLGSLGDSLEHVAAISENTARASNELPGLFKGVSRSLAAVEESVVTIGRAADGVERLVSGSERELAQFSRNTQVQVGQLLSELQKLVETLRRVGQDFQRDPNMLLFGRPRTRPGPGER